MEEMGKFEEIGRNCGKLVDSKSRQYGESAIETVEVLMCHLFPRGIPLNKIGESILISRILEKLCRITFGDGSGDEDAFADIQGYGMIGSAEGKRKTEVRDTFAEF